jgi:hypothetical protein
MRFSPNRESALTLIYSIHSMPRAIYRANGNPADEIAARLDFDRADDMIELANRLFDRARDAEQHVRRQERASRRSTHAPVVAATLPASAPQRGKLSRADADVIRRAVADGADRRDLARYYHVHASTIGDIVRRVYLK